MLAEERESAEFQIRQFPGMMEQATNGLLCVNVYAIWMDEPLVPDGIAEYDHCPWIASWNINHVIRDYDLDQYDGLFLFVGSSQLATRRQAINGSPAVNYVGLTIPRYSYMQVDANWWRSNRNGTRTVIDAMVHEFGHQLESYFRDVVQVPNLPALHDGEEFGFTYDLRLGWMPWYRQYLTGTLPGQLGITEDYWRNGGSPVDPPDQIHPDAVRIPHTPVTLVKDVDRTRPRSSREPIISPRGDRRRSIG